MGGRMFVCRWLSPFIVPGSQHWMVYRVLDERVG
jgi:hypothetical protein